MVRRFFRDSAVYALPAALSRGSPFCCFRSSRTASPQRTTASWTSSCSSGSLAAVTAALKSLQGLGRYIVGEEDADVRQDYASTALLFTIAAYTAFVLVVEAAASPITDAVLGPDMSPALMRVAGGWMWLTGVLYLAQNQLRWELRPARYAAASGLMATVTALSSALFVLVLHMSVMGALLGQLFGAAVRSRSSSPSRAARSALRCDSRMAPMVRFSVATRALGDGRVPECLAPTASLFSGHVRSPILVALLPTRSVLPNGR